MNYTMHPDFCRALLNHESIHNVYTQKCRSLSDQQAELEWQHSGAKYLEKVMRLPEDNPARIATEAYLNCLLENSEAIDE